jgi:hypothetical protein
MVIIASLEDVDGSDSEELDTPSWLLLETVEELLSAAITESLIS